MLVKRSFSLAGHRTSVALEPEFWAVLEQKALSGGQSLVVAVAQIDAGRTPSEPLASRLRVAALVFALTSPKGESGNLGAG